MQKLGKKPLLTFIATFNKIWTIPSSYSAFLIENHSPSVEIPSAMLRRNFPQAKTNTRLKIQFYPWELDVGRTIWFKNNIPDNLYYTFSRRGKIIKSTLPYPLQRFLRNNLGLAAGTIIKLKMVVTAI